MRSTLLIVCLLSLVVAPIAARRATAESGLTLRAPLPIEPMDATTFDVRGRAVGRSSFEVETGPEGRQRLRVVLAIEGGGRNVSEATMSPVGGPPLGGSPIAGAAAGGLAGDSERSPRRSALLRLVEQRSQSTDATGATYPLLVIDHRKGRVSCYPDANDLSRGEHLEIEGEDRVVNVPMQLLFQPLVRGETDAVRFQLAACANGPVIHSMIAVRGGEFEREGRRVVEVEYGPDFGRTVAWLASRLLPSFSFWFDAADGRYLGHRMPLHRTGPEVLLVRQGLTPPDLGLRLD